jgi:hypothetical protein
MVNAWVLFVKEYAKKNNISYGCAISKAGEEYRALKSGKKVETVKKTEIVKVDPKKIEMVKPVVKVIRQPKLIENPTITKAEKKAILSELTTNLNALKKQQSRMPSSSRLVDIAEMEAKIIKYSKM